MKQTALLIIAVFISSLVIGLSPLPSTSEPAVDPSKTAGQSPAVPGASTSGLGPSVRLSYAFPALLAESVAAYSWGYMGVAVDGGSMTDSHLSTLNTLPFAYYFYYYDIDTSYNWVAMDVVTVFEGLTGVGTYNTQHDFQVCYSGITTFTWNITTWFYDISTNAWVQQDCHVGTPAGPGGTYTLLDTPSLTYTTSYIDATGDFRVKVRGWAQIVAGGGGFILGNRIRMNQPRTTRTAMTETRRVSYVITGGAVLYTLSFMAPESMTAVTVTYPTAWDWQSIQPSANIAETSGQIIITNTDQDTVYSASFMAPAVATGNLELVYEETFDDGVTPWQIQDSVTSLVPEYTIVGEGTASAKFVCSGWGGIRIDDSYTSDKIQTNGVYYCLISTYVVGACSQLRFYVQVSAGVTIALTCDPAESRWETWYFKYTHTQAGSDRREFVLYSASGTPTVYMDGFRVYQSSVATGTTITGTCNIIHPAGYTPASGMEVFLGLWDAAYAWKSYKNVLTAATGAWSIAASTLYGSLTAQTYKLWTWAYDPSNTLWAPDAATEATTDWTETIGSSSTVTTSTTRQEGLYSVYNQARFNSADFIQPTYNPTGLWDFDQAGYYYETALLTGWFYLNTTTHVNYVRLAMWQGANYGIVYIFNYGTTGYYGFAANTWTRVTVPLSSSYMTIYSGLNFAAVDYFGFTLSNSTNTDTEGFGSRIDSLNCIRWGHTYNTLPVYQLGMASVTFEKINDQQSLFTANSPTYASQLYTITLDSKTIATDVASGTIVTRNSTVGSHTYSVIASSYNTYAHLDSTAKTGQYVISASGFAIDAVSYGFGDVECFLYVRPNYDCSYNVFENDSSVKSGSILDDGGTIVWGRDLTAGALVRVGTKFTYGATNIWVNSSYKNTANAAFTIEAFVPSYSDTTCFAFLKPNYDASYEVFENDVSKGTGTIYTIGTTISWARNTSAGATISYGIKCSYGGSSIWMNSSYSNVVSESWEVTAVFSASDTYIDCNILSNYAASWVAYENDSNVASGSIAAGGASFRWTRDITAGVLRVGVELSYSTQTRWCNWSYSNPVAEALKITVWANWFDTDKIRVVYQTNWLNTTIYCYDNDSLIASRVEGPANFTRSDTVGLHLISFKIDGGTDYVWVNRSYAVEAAALELAIFEVHLVEGWVSIAITTNWANTSITVLEEFNGANVTKLSGVDEADCTGYLADRGIGTHKLYITIDGGAENLTRISSFDIRYVPDTSAKGTEVAAMLFAVIAIAVVVAILLATIVVLIVKGGPKYRSVSSGPPAPKGFVRTSTGFVKREGKFKGRRGFG